MFFRKIMKQNMTQEPIVYQTGTDVKLINKAEYCKSIIADGKELIIGNESGVITVPELKDPKVYITFKEGITNFSDVFLGCIKLTSVPANLFANHPNATSFSGAFFGCMSLNPYLPVSLPTTERSLTSTVPSLVARHWLPFRRTYLPNARKLQHFPPPSMLAML